MSQIILASSSVYRKELLQRLSLKFKVINPDIDETKIESENAYESAERLAEEKAKKIASKFKEAIVIGCDQTAEYNNIQIEKPLNYESSLSQLKELSGLKMMVYIYASNCNESFLQYI